jgi:hypothetical protein
VGLELKRKGDFMVERGEYQGKPVITLRRTENDKFPFSFGLNKARLILENIEEIRKFVQENTREETA